MSTQEADRSDERVTHCSVCCSGASQHKRVPEVCVELPGHGTSVITKTLPSPPLWYCVFCKCVKYLEDE